MTPFISFLIKANIVLILLYGFYFLCFRRDTFYGQIRWYLIATMISIIIFPIIDISVWFSNNSVALEVPQFIPSVDVIYRNVFSQPQMEQIIESRAVHNIPISLVLLWCWISVAVFMIGRRFFQFIYIIRLLSHYPKKRYGNCFIVSVERKIQPFSFINYIFLNSSLYTKENLDEIITHEQVHCRQGHTFDILLIEIIVCLFWFNPIAWLLRQDLKQNLEYYTDRITLMSGFDRKHYQYSLLHVSDSNFQIVNNFNLNNLKKRIIMMNKKESPRIMSAKYLTVLPALLAVFLIMQISGLQAKNFKSSQQPVPETVKIFGTVTNTEGKTMPGVLVMLKGTSTGSVTDMNGKYSINVPSDATLKFSFIDVDSKEIVVGNQQIINVTLGDETQTEVKTISEYNFQVFPEDDTPIIVVDVPVTDIFKNISPNDIQFIKILKDQDATSSYGEKGKNGVIIITTKKKE